MAHHEDDRAQQSAVDGSKTNESTVSSTGDDVLGIIADVDRQLARIKEARKVQDEGLSSLAERFKALEQAEAGLQEARDKAEQQHKAAEAAMAETESERKKLAEQQQQLEARQAELQQQRDALDQGRDDLSGRLEKAEANVGELVQKIEELHEELEKQSGLVSEANAQRDALQQQLDQRDTELAEQRKKLELAGKKLTEFSSVLEEQAAQIEQSTTATALAKQQQKEIEQLKKQLASQDGKVDPQQLAEREARIAELEQQLAEASKAGKSDAKAQKKHEQQLANLQEQLASHEAELKQAQKELKSREQRIAELEHTVQTAEARKPEDQQARLTAMETLNRKRQQITERREALEKAERKMIRQWARPKAAVVTGWIFLVLCVNAAGAWLATNQFMPPQRTASITIAPRDAGSLEPAHRERWQGWHVGLLTDETFLTSLARRNSERRLDAYGDQHALAAYLQSNLTTSGNDDGSFVITLGGTDTWQTTALLDILASTLATESNRRSSQRSDQTPAVARGSPNLNPWRVDDTYLIRLGAVFGVLSTASIALLVFVYTRLIRVKRVFDEQTRASLA